MWINVWPAAWIISRRWRAYWTAMSVRVVTSMERVFWHPAAPPWKNDMGSEVGRLSWGGNVIVCQQRDGTCIPAETGPGEGPSPGMPHRIPAGCCHTGRTFSGRLWWTILLKPRMPDFELWARVRCTSEHDVRLADRGAGISRKPGIPSRAVAVPTMVPGAP